MKTARFPHLKALALLAAISCLLVAAASRALASSGADHINDGIAASQSWVAQIDAGKYEDSYNVGSAAMHTKVAQDRWVEVLSALRTPWGPVVSRKQISHIYRPNGYEGAEGEFMLVTYDTAFQHLNSATEVVVLKWEDGQWRGAGYNAGPKGTTDGSTPLPPVDTETHTDQHVHPEAQQ